MCWTDLKIPNYLGYIEWLEKELLDCYKLNPQDNYTPMCTVTDIVVYVYVLKCIHA